MDKHNTKTKSLPNKRTADPNLIYGNQIGETKKVKNNPYISIHKKCLQSFPANIKYLIKKPYILCVSKRETLTNLQEVSNGLRWVKKRLIKYL